MENLPDPDLSIQLVDRQVSDDGSISAIFEVAPLERGLGVTMGNTLRRICLSHLEGSSVTSLKIHGVSNEFTTLPHVLEDTVELVLNFKSLVFKTELEEQFTCSVSFDGPGEIKASDLVLPAGVEVVNPNLLLATITKKAKFEAELTARKGFGYVLAEEQEAKKSLDVITLDSVFMPIRKFSFKTEQIKIGESSEASSNKSEKLIIEIISNGSIEPDKALSQASKILLQRFTPFMNLTGETLPLFTAIPEQEVQQEEDFTDVGIETLNLSVRAYNCLKRANKNSLKDLLHMTTDELMSIKNFGKKSAEEVIKILNERGFYLADDFRRNSGEVPVTTINNAGQEDSMSSANPFGHW